MEWVGYLETTWEPETGLNKAKKAITRFERRREWGDGGGGRDARGASPRKGGGRAGRGGCVGQNLGCVVAKIATTYYLYIIYFSKILACQRAMQSNKKRGRRWWGGRGR